jgi:RHS repeat-associated protein
VREDEGAWEPLSAACAGESTYAGEPAHRYTFHLTASDNVGNGAAAETQAAISRVTKYYYHGGQRVAMRRGSVVYYVHADHLGSTSLTTDENGDVVARQLYHPYGTVRWNEGTLPTDFGFTGQRHDGTGLIFMHARYCHAALGRFASADSMVPSPENPQSLNRYSYVLNSPLNFTDPSGHAFWAGSDIAQEFDLYKAPMGHWSAREQSAIVDQVFATITDFAPVVGDAKGVVEGITGKDWDTGESIGLVGRGLSLMCLSELRHADEATDIARYAGDLLDDNVVIRFLREEDYAHLLETGKLRVYGGQTFSAPPRFLANLDDLAPENIAIKVLRGEPGYGDAIARSQYFAVFNPQDLAQYRRFDYPAIGEIVWRGLPIEGSEVIGGAARNTGFVPLSEFVGGRTEQDLLPLLQALGIR